VANHLTPEELSKELGIDRQEIIRLCIEESIPIYHGKIDRSLFEAQLQASGADLRAGGDGRAGPARPYGPTTSRRPSGVTSRASASRAPAASAPGRRSS
jgi:hypothetical protein